MTMPRFESTISLGHLVQLVSLVIAGATACLRSISQKVGFLRHFLRGGLNKDDVQRR